VSYLSQVKDSLARATQDTTRFMSAHLRIEARKSGWPDDVVRHLSVRHSDGEFTVHSHEDHRSTVMDLEYGTPNQRPTAAIRRFGNRTAASEKFLLNRTAKYLKGHR
jgi:hypothetical protein